MNKASLVPDTDTLQVIITQEKERTATGADLSVTVEGSSLVTGEMALRKAREVALLAAALEDVGIASGDIALQSVRADTSQGKVIKTSAAHFQMRVRCEPLDKLADVLGVVTSQKNVTLSGMIWRYPDDSDDREAWLDECLAQANRKARRMADALGVRLLGVRSCTEQYTEYGDGNDRHAITLLDASSGMRRARITAEELGLEVSHAKQARLSVTVEYRISRFAGNVPSDETP